MKLQKVIKKYIAYFIYSQSNYLPLETSPHLTAVKTAKEVLCSFMSNNSFVFLESCRHYMPSRNALDKAVFDRKITLNLN